MLNIHNPIYVMLCTWVLKCYFILLYITMAINTLSMYHANNHNFFTQLHPFNPIYPNKYQLQRVRYFNMKISRIKFNA